MSFRNWIAAAGLMGLASLGGTDMRRERHQAQLRAYKPPKAASNRQKLLAEKAAKRRARREGGGNG